MGKFKHDGSSVDTTKGGGYQGEQPKPGIYEAVLVLCEEHTAASSDQEGTHWVFEITDGPYTGWRGHQYTNDDTTLWKQDQILTALGLQEAGGRFEGTHEGIVKKGGPVRIKTNQEEYEGEKRGRIRTILPPLEGQEAPKAKGKGKKSKDSEPF